MKYKENFMNKSSQSVSFIDELFYVELVSNASFDCYPNNTLSSFTNLLPEQINLEVEWEVPITELSYPSLYQNFTYGKFFYLNAATPDTKPSDYYTSD